MANKIDPADWRRRRGGKPTIRQAAADMGARRTDRPDTVDGRGLDPGIRDVVLLLWDWGIETCQSCEGGPGHSYLEPTVDFLGGPAEGPRALGIAMTHGLRVSELRRVWKMQDGEPTGPIWSMTFDSPTTKRWR